MENNIKKVVGIKQEEGKLLYKFSKSPHYHQILNFDETYAVVGKQHGDYFEICIIKGDKSIDIQSPFDYASYGIISVTMEVFIKGIKKLLNRSNLIQNIKFNFQSQTVDIECDDKLWGEIFKGADTEAVNTYLFPYQYTCFLHKNLGQVRRL